MPRIELSKEAERDLVEIYLYGAELFGLTQAEHYLGLISNKLETAAEHPDIGPDYSHVRGGLRRLECVSHAIYYRSRPDGILVMRILGGRMDPGRHLLE